MRKPVSHYQIATVERLVRSGVSARKAARQAGMSHDTAAKIANGKHVSQFSEESEVTMHSVPEYECPGCGRTANTAPCATCLARRGR